MNRCKRVNHRGAVGTAPKAASHVYGHSRRKTLNRPAVLAPVPGKTSLRAGTAGSAASRDEPAPATLFATPPWLLGLFETKSGLDITQKVIELLWLASERGYLTFEVVHQAFSGHDLTPDDLSVVRGTLGQAGVALVDLSTVGPGQSAAQTAADGSVYRETQVDSVQSGGQRTGEAQLLPRDAEIALSRRMEEADHEMRQILYGFDFAAHEHVARAEKLLAHPSDESFERLVSDSEVRSRIQYLPILPKLIKETQVLDRKAAAAHRKWRQALGQANGEEHRTEFRKLNRKLQQLFPTFRYQAKVIQEMSAIAQNIAGRFRASQHVLQEAQRGRDSVCQSLVDVERQTIEAMEEFVRLPREVFLRNCIQLKAAETRFQQARCELIRAHLHLVASMAGTYSNRGLPLPKLVRHGVLGLLRSEEIRLPARMELLYLCRMLDSTKHACCAGSPAAAGAQPSAAGRLRRPHEPGPPAGRTSFKRPVI
jgi:RNA polymerase primary sigma factor